MSQKPFSLMLGITALIVAAAEMPGQTGLDSERLNAYALLAGQDKDGFISEDAVRRIVAELQAIRAFGPTVANIDAAAQFDVKTFLMGVRNMVAYSSDPIERAERFRLVLAKPLATGIPQLDELNKKFGVSEMRLFSFADKAQEDDWIEIHFAQPIDAGVVAHLYSEALGSVTSPKFQVQPNVMMGDGNRIERKENPDGSVEYALSVGWGDCPAGCIHRAFYRFKLRPSTNGFSVQRLSAPDPISANSKDHEDYIRIQHGTFKMGCVPADVKCKDEEKPQHEVTITKDFYIGRNEVQVDSFWLFLGQTQKKPKMPPEPAQDYDHWKRDTLPMVMVYWQDAVAYCKWAGGRLPTEAEWEYAARAGSSDEVYPLNRVDSRDKANFEHTQGNDIYEGVAPVRKFEPNTFGLYDMSGNVWEWVSDAFDEKYYSDSPSVDPPGPAGSASATEHVVRGGSFENEWQVYSRLSYRKALSGRDWKTGFRCVLDDTPETHKNLLKIPLPYQQ